MQRVDGGGMSHATTEGEEERSMVVTTSQREGARERQHNSRRDL